MVWCLKNFETKLIFFFLVIIFFNLLAYIFIFNYQDPVIEVSKLEIVPKDDGKNSSTKIENSLVQSYQESNESLVLFQEGFRDLEPIFFNFTTPILQKNREYSSEAISCKPRLDGHSDSKANLYFPVKYFQDCKLQNRQNIIKVEGGDSISINCPVAGGKYFLGSPPNTERLGRIEYKINWLDVVNNKIIDMKNSEFVMVKCSNSIKDAYLRNIYNLRAAERAKNISEKLLNDSKSKKKTPFGVHIIMLDSISRQHFYRTLKETTTYINNNLVNSEEYIVYDFLTNNAHGENTRPNLVAFLLGKDFIPHESVVKEIKDNKEKNLKQYEEIQNSSLWKHYERLGYVTMFGFDTIWNFFCDDIGNIVFTDSAVLNFWNAAKTVFNYADFITRQRCFGQKNAHRHLLDYQIEFVKHYKNRNKFTYLHSSIAHENTGTIIKTLDKDLHEHLNELIRVYKDNQEDFFIVIAGDHGRKVGEWDWTDEGIFENKHPFHLIITKKSIIREMGESTHTNIIHNTERLVGRFDWYVSLKQLAHFPYETLNKDSSSYVSYKNSVPTNNAVSVFLEKIPNNRQCKDINIDSLYCLCRDYEPIDNTSPLVTKTLTDLLKTTLAHINSNILKTSACKKLTLNTVLRSSELRLKQSYEGGDRHLKLLFSIKEDENARIEIQFYAAEEKDLKKSKKAFPNYPSTVCPGPYLQNYLIKVEDFYTVNKYSCDSTNEEAKICVC